MGLYCETIPKKEWNMFTHFEKNTIVMFFFSDPIFPGGVWSSFMHLSLGKAGPFT